MQTQVKAIFDFSQIKYHLHQYTEEEGMSNSVSWVYLAEDIQNVSFLKGGELVITTGLFTQSGVKLIDFVREMALKNCSAIIINIGKYLFQEDITTDIISFCKINKIPLFSMPWEIHLVDIMQDYSVFLFQDSHKSDVLSATLQSAVYQTPITENILRTLNQYGFVTINDYRLITIRNLREASRITSPLNSYGLKYHLFKCDNLDILIYQATSDSISLDRIIDILCYCDSIILGISDMIHSLTDISACYKRAQFSLVVAEFWNRQTIRFDDLGIFQLLFCTSSPELLPSIYLRYLGPLEKYDQEHNSKYMETLRIYLLSDCNLLETSSRMFTHRNTIVYRIKKIKELLNSELDNSTIKFNLLMAFYIKEFLCLS